MFMYIQYEKWRVGLDFGQKQTIQTRMIQGLEETGSEHNISEMVHFLIILIIIIYLLLLLLGKIHQ